MIFRCCSLSISYTFSFCSYHHPWPLRINNHCGGWPCSHPCLQSHLPPISGHMTARTWVESENWPEQLQWSGNCPSCAQWSLQLLRSTVLCFSVRKHLTGGFLCTVLGLSGILWSLLIPEYSGIKRRGMPFPGLRNLGMSCLSFSIRWYVPSSFLWTVW